MMAPNVTGFLNSQRKTQDLLAHADGQEYLSCLESFWNGDPSLALDLATQLLAKDPEHPRRLELYRLWIEVLAECGETLSLHGLNDHLLLLGRTETGETAPLMALRGLIHLELDQMDAARLLARGLEKAPRSAAVVEFLNRYATRSSSEPNSLDLLTCKGPVTDYFHWRELCLNAVELVDDVAMVSLLEKCEEVFPDAPVRDEINLQELVSSGQNTRARALAVKLSKKFPANAAYAFTASVMTFRAGDPRGAMELLSQAPGLDPHVDGDAALLMGQCLLAVAEQTRNEDEARDAARHFKRSIELFKAEGMPTLEATRCLAVIDEKFKPKSSASSGAQLFRPTRAWFVKLSAQRYHEICTSSEAAVSELVRPLGNKAMPGDLCFFAAQAAFGSEKKRQTNWHIAAIYAVASPPAWDPMQGQVSALHLISRPAEPVAVDVEIVDAGASRNEKRDRGHPLNHGVFELGDGALDVITEAVRQRSHGDAAMIRERRENSRVKTS